MSIFLNGAAPSEGTRDARVGAIKAILLNATYYKTAGDGAKYVEAPALADYIRAELLKIGNATVAPTNGDNVPGGRQAAVIAASQTVGIGNYLTAWSQLVGRGNWVNNPDFPATRDMTDAERVSAIIVERDKLRAAVVRLQEHYEKNRAEVLNGLPSGYDNVVSRFLPALGIRNTTSRSYVYTYVTSWGWESAPSPPSNIFEADENDVVTVAAPAIPPGGATVATNQFGINRVRLYRSSTTNAGGAFQFVVESSIPVTWTLPLNYNDTLKQSELGEVCPTMTWLPPPDAMKGLHAMANGVLIGFVGNQIILSEPFIPYAYPAEYRLTTEHKIVGIGVFGQSAVVVTEGFPYYVSGADSATMSAQRMEFNQSCVSKRTIAAADGGVLYASPDGMCLASSGGVVVLTEGAYSRRDWQAFLGAQGNWPAAFGEYHEGVYYLFNSAGGGLAIDIKSRKVSSLTQSCSGIYTDLITDKLHVVSGTTLLELFGGGSTNAAVWRSKVFVTPDTPGFSALRVESDFESAVVVKVYGEGVLRHTATFSGATARQPQRLPPGRYREWEIQIEASCPVTRVAMATSMPELKAT